MNELQKKLLELLKEIDTICRKNNIVYYIDGGSAIGVIRHKGFIPWDDDIDIVMTRNNYNKFISIIDKQIPKNRKIENFERNKKYSMLYARYCDITSTCILRTSMLDVFESGVFIDIFILDPMPRDEKQCKKNMRLLRAYSEFINPYYFSDIISSDTRELRKLSVLHFFLGRKKLHKYIEKKLFSYSEDECVNYCFRFDLNPFIYPKSFFEEPITMKFEGLDVYAPTNIVDYLKIHYGDTWMYIPLHDEQQLHNLSLNLKVPYRKFVDDYYRFVPKDALKVYKKFHGKRLRVANYNDKIDAINVTSDAKLKGILIKKNLEKNNIKLLFEKNNYLLIEELFSDYLKLQLNKKVRKNKIVVDIGSNDYYIIYCLIKTGKYYDAKKILGLIPNKYPELESKVKLTEDLNEKFYKKDFDSYYKILNENYENCNDIIDFIEAKVNHLIYEKKYNAALEIIDKTVKKYSKTDFLLKYKADIIFKENKKEALNLYNEVKSKTRNGILILDINEKLGE